MEYTIGFEFIELNDANELNGHTQFLLEFMSSIVLNSDKLLRVDTFDSVLLLFLCKKHKKELLNLFQGLHLTQYFLSLYKNISTLSKSFLQL